MKLLSFIHNGEPSFGVLEGGDRVCDLSHITHQGRPVRSLLDLIREVSMGLHLMKATDALAKKIFRLDEVTLLAPIPRPAKNIFCVGKNYKEHIVEAYRALGVPAEFPSVPEFFSKPPTTVIGEGGGIWRHEANTSKLDYEVELAVVIGKTCRNVSVERALENVLGYTIINDVTARDAQFAHGQWFKGKSFDTFCPMGPWIVTSEEFGDPGGRCLKLKVNGELRQDSTTADLLFSVPQIIASLSAGLTLEPGDIIATGTPAGVAFGMSPPRWLQVGDVVEAEIEGIGALRNTVVAG
jgi:2-keto-4-pentenoate hydratase/2-oxohepta-3-ene-1,7-dioic acid hydratase in catechol pathway